MLKKQAVGGAGWPARFQDHTVPGDHSSFADISNGQVIVQKVDGIVQFFVQAGIYSLPSLGTPYTRASRLNEATFGPVPQAFIKIAPTSSFSVEVGKLPTLIGAEYTFTFENMNVDRGLLWNLEPAVLKGVQANYSHGPLAFSVSLNDGYYSFEVQHDLGLGRLYARPRRRPRLRRQREYEDDDRSTPACRCPAVLI